MTKKCILDKAGDGNVVLDLAISAKKYSKIVSQEKKIFQGFSWSILLGYFLLFHFIFKETHIDVNELYNTRQLRLTIFKK